jgi:oligoribonuclease NrnB/cAMP/cGMP phosphodiesterase (DHH superfamily)
MFATSSPALSSSLSSSRSSLRKTNTSIMYTKKTKISSSSSQKQKQKQRRNVVVVLAEAAESNNDNNSNNNEEKQCTGGSCDSCGVAREKMQCDGTGRIQGGLAAIPLFSWWPIKAYRPCPGLIESGGTYTRKGQDVDSILWGENGRD